MSKIIERGNFNYYKITDTQLNESLSKTISFSKGIGKSDKKTVFLSHKHTDLDELKDFIGFFQKKYNVQVYIDSMDKSMPDSTSGETAIRIKKVIGDSNKFILLATDDAIASKWCNWELGYGDAKKYPYNIALFPVRERNTDDNYYKGKEYMQIYPYIGAEEERVGYVLELNYYVYYYDSYKRLNRIPLNEWINR